MVSGSNSFWDELDKKMYGTPRAASSSRPGLTTPVSSFANYLGGIPGATKPIGEEDPALAQLNIDKARISGAQRILSDPIARTQNPEFLIRDLEKIAKGESPSTPGIEGAFKNAVSKVGEGFLWGLGRPLAAVTSVAKEIADIPSGGFSVNELVSQALAKDTTPSKYISKTGIGWLDQSIGLVVDIAADPLTYVTFGASAYAGRNGRLLLSSKAATKEAIERAPSLRAKVDDGSIAKLGEWALDGAERLAVGLPEKPGISFAFGSKGAIAKPGTLAEDLSAGAATVVGKNLAKIRGGIGSSKAARPFQKVTASKSAKIAGLEMYGRVADDPQTVNRIADLATYSSAIRANANGSFIARKFGSLGQNLAREVREYEEATGRRIHEVTEGVRDAVDDYEADLAGRASKFIRDMRDDQNARTADFGARRNVKAYIINDRENYVPHTLTKESRDFIGSKRWAGTRWDSTVRQSLDMTAKEFREGPPPLRGRKLLGPRIENGVEVPGEKFLGVRLKTSTADGSATIREINDISQKLLKFKWFEEDGAQYIENYLDSIVAQTKRVSFADRLFDYGEDVVRPIMEKVIPNKEVIREWEKTVALYDNLITPVLESLSKAGVKAGDVLGPRLSLAEAVASSRPGAKILSPDQITQIRGVLKQIENQLRITDNVVSRKPKEIRQAYQTIAAPLRGRLDAVTQALDADDHENLLATTGLRELYQRLLPDADDIPSDPKALAEDIIDAAEALRGTPIAQGLGIEDDFSDVIKQAVEGISRRSSITEVPTGTGPVVAARDEAETYAQNLAKTISEKESAAETLIGIPKVIAEMPDVSKKLEAGDALKNLEMEILKINKNAAKAAKAAATPEEAAKITRAATRATKPLRDEVKKVQAIMDSGRSIAAAADDWDNTIGRYYAEDFRKVIEDVGQRPPPGAAGEAMSMWTERTRDILNSLDNAKLVLNPEEYELMSRLVTQMKGLEANLAMYEQVSEFSAAQLARARSGELGGDMARKVIRNWERIESLGIQMPPDVRDRMFGRVGELLTPQGQSQWAKMYNSYNRFFKVTAMLSPGFIVRNSYTAAFNNFVAGVTPKEVTEGLRFATSIWKNGLDNALGKLPAETRDLYEQALKVTYATGAGQSADDIMAPILAGKGAKWVNRQPIAGWAKANETAEVAARFSLALSSLKRGMDFDAAVGQVTRYHFDYTDLSSLDEFARKFIPFWIFASRNIPLQMVNQIARPSMYRMYESVQRNFGVEEDEGIPNWLARRNPIRLPGMGPGEYIDIDLPHIDMRDQINMMTDPIRLASQFNPLVKLPIEMAGNQQLWSGSQFSRKPQEVRGPLDYPAYLAGLLFGDAGVNPQTGQRWTNTKAAYAIPNLVPTLAQFQRLIPELGGKEAYVDRATSSRASYFGLPYRRVSPEEQFNELTRRQFAIRDYLSGRTRRGEITPKQ